MNLYINLNKEGEIRNAIKKVYAYERNLPLALKELEDRLIDRGITMAQSKMTALEGRYETQTLIRFSRRYTVTNTGCEALLMEIDIAPIVATWINHGDDVTADVSPSWMLEFGSGIYALEGHAGTFPSDTAKANVERGYWSWTERDGSKHISSGIVPTQPLYNAMIDMYKSVINEAKEVFR